MGQKIGRSLGCGCGHNENDVVDYPAGTRGVQFEEEREPFKRILKELNFNYSSFDEQIFMNYFFDEYKRQSKLLIRWNESKAWKNHSRLKQNVKGTRFTELKHLIRKYSEQLTNKGVFHSR